MKTWNDEHVPPELLEQVPRLEAMPEDDIDFGDRPEATANVG